MTEYAKPIDKVADGLSRGSRMPTYVAFITDGANHDKRDTTKAIQRAFNPNIGSSAHSSSPPVASASTI